MNAWRILNRATLRQGFLLHASRTRKSSQGRSAIVLPSLSLKLKLDGRWSHSKALGQAKSVTDATLPFSGSAVDMDDILIEVVRQIHASPTMAVFYVAGGGLQVDTCSPKDWNDMRRTL